MTYEEAKNTIEEKYEAEKMECTCSPCKKCASIKLHKKSVEEAEKVVAVYELVRKTISTFPSVKIEEVNKDTNLKYDLDISGYDVFFLLQDIEIECNVVNLTKVSEFVNQVITVEDLVNSVVEKMKK